MWYEIRSRNSRIKNVIPEIWVLDLNNLFEIKKHHVKVMSPTSSFFQVLHREKEICK